MWVRVDLCYQPQHRDSELLGVGPHLHKTVSLSFGSSLTLHLKNMLEEWEDPHSFLHFYFLLFYSLPLKTRYLLS